MPVEENLNVYELIGGYPTFERLVNIFYDKIAQDSYLRPMFPENLESGKHWQKLFLIQYFGGPAHYAVERGHPRLRMRHAPFPIDEEAAQRWLRHMLSAIDEVAIPEPARGIMRQYFERAAPFMINQG